MTSGQVVSYFSAPKGWSLGLSAMDEGTLVICTRVFFFPGFHLPERRNFHTDSWYNVCTDFGALIYALILAQMFVCRFLVCTVQIFAQIFVQISLRRFGALKIGVPESRKSLHKSGEKSVASQQPVPGRVPSPSPLP